MFRILEDVLDTVIRMDTLFVELLNKSNLTSHSCFFSTYGYKFNNLADQVKALGHRAF